MLLMIYSLNLPIRFLFLAKINEAIKVSKVELVGLFCLQKIIVCNPRFVPLGAFVMCTPRFTLYRVPVFCTTRFALHERPLCVTTSSYFEY